MNSTLVRAVRETSIAHPKSYVANTEVHKTFRFQASTAGVYTISPCKLCALNVTATTTILGIQDYEYVRLRRIEIWAGPPATLVPNEVSVALSGSAIGLTGNEISRSDVSMSATRPAHVCLRPNLSTQSGQYLIGNTSNGTTPFLTLTVPVGAIIDVEVDLKMTKDLRTTNNSVAIVGATIGAKYYLALDNAAGALGSVSSFLVPMSSLPTA